MASQIAASLMGISSIWEILAKEALMPDANVLSLEKSHYKEASEVLARAFFNDPAVVTILNRFPTQEDERIKRLNNAFFASIEISRKKGTWFPYVELDDRIAGAAIVHPPGVYPLPIMSQVGILSKTILRTRSLHGMRRWMTWINSIEKEHPDPKDTPHYYLEFIGVDAAHQGKGLGSSILGAVTQRADQEQTGVFLETANPQNLAQYDRFGFETISERDILGAHAWFMWRPAVS